MNAISKSRQLKVDIIRKIYYRNAMSLTELSKGTGKSIPVVTQAVADLCNNGELTEQDTAPSTGGRRPVVYSYNTQLQRYILSITTDIYESRVAIYDQFKTRIYGIKTVALDLINNPGWFQPFIQHVKKCLSDSGVDTGQIIGAGVSMPGFVDNNQGTNETYPVEGNTNIASLIADELGFPVYLDNDSRLIALAEMRFGQSADLNEFLVINLGWGTGLGMVIDGKIFRGFSSYAGEFSHIPLSETGELCTCGKRGCLETETSLLAMERRVRAAVSGGAMSIWPKLETIMKADGKSAAFFESAKRGDSLIVSVFSDAAYVLGKGIATLIHIMNPQTIVLSGKGSCVGDMYVPAIQQALNVYCIPRIMEKTKLQVSTIGEDAELLGAACMVIDQTDFRRGNYKI